MYKVVKPFSIVINKMTQVLDKTGTREECDDYIAKMKDETLQARHFQEVGVYIGGEMIGNQNINYLQKLGYIQEEDI